MTMTDPISDMLTRIRNAHMALHKTVSVPRSKVKEAIAEILKEEGYIKDIEIFEREIKITLKYVNGKPAILNLVRASKPGRRKYVSVSEIPNVQNGLGINIISTSKGIMVGERAKHENIGGELICQIW